MFKDVNRLYLSPEEKMAVIEKGWNRLCLVELAIDSSVKGYKLATVGEPYWRGNAEIGDNGFMYVQVSFELLDGEVRPVYLRRRLKGKIIQRYGRWEYDPKH